MESNDATHAALAGDALDGVVWVFFQKCAGIFQPLLVDIGCAILIVAAILNDLAQSVFINLKQVA